MKKLILILIALFYLLGIGANGYDRNYSIAPTFEELLEQSIKKVQGNPTSEGLLNCVSELKRINAMYPDNWLSYYYGILFELQYSLLNLSANTESLLKDAKDSLDMLKKNKKANASEVCTLEGYYYYVLIAKDPAKNGSAYYKNVFDSYQKALNLNPNNPRARLMLLTFKLDMGQFLGEKPRNMYQELLTIKKMYEEESPKRLEPTWGKISLDKMLQQYSNGN